MIIRFNIQENFCTLHPHPVKTHKCVHGEPEFQVSIPHMHHLPVDKLNGGRKNMFGRDINIFQSSEAELGESVLSLCVGR